MPKGPVLSLMHRECLHLFPEAFHPKSNTKDGNIHAGSIGQWLHRLDSMWLNSSLSSAEFLTPTGLKCSAISWLFKKINTKQQIKKKGLSQNRQTGIQIRHWHLLPVETWPNSNYFISLIHSSFFCNSGVIRPTYGPVIRIKFSFYHNDIICAIIGTQ